MMKKKIEYDRIVDALLMLKKQYPTYTMGQHISTALSEYPDFWGITDKEFLFALTKYQTELELDNSHIVDDTYVSKIIEDGMNLDRILDDEEEEE